MQHGVDRRKSEALNRGAPSASLERGEARDRSDSAGWSWIES